MPRAVCHRCKTSIPPHEDFYIHHLGHIQWPTVKLRRLSNQVLSELEQTGTLRLKPKPKVTPIKIAVRKRGECNEFFVSSENNFYNMQGLNGISIQRKNGQTCSMAMLPRDEAQPRNDNPLELLERLSGSGIRIDRRPSKPHESDMRDGDVNATKDVAEKTVEENMNSNNMDHSSVDDAGPVDPEDSVVGETGIDILKKLLASVPLRPEEVDDDVIIEEEIPRLTNTPSTTVTEQSEKEADTESRNNNNLGTAVPEEPTPSENFPHAEIRVSNNLGQHPNFWNGGTVQQIQPDPLSTPNDCQNFLSNLIGNANDPPEFLTLEQLDQGLQQASQNCAQINRIQPPAQISVIPQRQMQAPRRVSATVTANMPSPQLHPPGVRVRAPAPPPPPPYEQVPQCPPGYRPYRAYPPQRAVHPPQVGVPQRRPRAPRASRPHLQPRSFASMAAPRMPVKRGSRMPNPGNIAAKIRRVNSAVSPSSSQAEEAATALAMRGITVTATRPQNPTRSSLPPNPANNTAVSSAPITNHNVPRPEPCATVDLTADEISYPCPLCGKEFSNLTSLTTHKALHQRVSSVSRFKCDQCNAGFASENSLNTHKLNSHTRGNDLAIPVVNLALPGAQVRLAQAGITSYIPLPQLQGSRNGQYALPIINVETNGKVAKTSLESLGASNVLLLGKLTPLLKK